MSKTILQEHELYISDIDVELDDHGNIMLFQYDEIEDNDDCVLIHKSKSREVALAIHPELERELEHAANLIHSLTFDDPNICDLAKKEVNEFISKYRKE